MKDKLAEAVHLRSSNRPEDAVKMLTELLVEHPNDPNVNYQMAWTCDFMGSESEAVPYYEKAIAHGLSEGRAGAMLGLGSTYRCLGEYEKSLKILNQAVDEFPQDRALKVFRALTLYNLGHNQDSVAEILVQLIETTSDKGILSYEKALRFYSDKLDQVWT